MTHFMTHFARTLPLLVSLFSAPAPAATLSLEPARDNTLYEDLEGDVSNGAGQHVIAGKTAIAQIRRGLIYFNVAPALPPGAVVLSARLTVTVSRVSGGNVALTLHRVLADWGEGTSDAVGEEGQGAPATPGDATWVHRFYPNVPWSSAGGDFAATATASMIVGPIGVYTWESTPELVADVQSWIDDPASNFGWLVYGEEGLTGTSKRLDSRTNNPPSTRPRLEIEYTAPVDGPGDLDSASWGRIKSQFIGARRF